MIKLLFATFVGALLSCSAAMATCPTWHTLTNGSTADASQVMDNFDVIVGCPNFTGNVGIGTSSPGSLLEVMGNSYPIPTARLSGNGAALGFFDTAGTHYNWLAAAQWNVGGGFELTPSTTPGGSTFSTPALTVLYNRNVGIGTTSPNSNLEISGSSGIRISGTTDTTLLLVPSSGSTQNTQIHQSGDNFSIGGFGVSNAFVINLNAPSNALYISSTSNVGIGTTSPAKTLTVVGDIRVGTSGTNGCIENFAGGNLAGTCSSDARLKTVTGSVTGVLDKLSNLQLVRFHWNTTAERLYHNSPSVLNAGFIAQAVEEQFPELVSVDKKGYRQLDYTTLSLYGLEAIKELKAAHDADQRDIRKQAAQIEQLRAEISALRRHDAIRTARR